MTNITISAQVFEDMADRIEELEAKLFTCATDLDTYMNAHAALEAKMAQQDDLVQAAVAAALREAAGIASYHTDWGDAQSAILALIPEGAQAALDRYVEKVTRSERSE